MRYLLDTHAILWCAQGNDCLPAGVRAIIRGEECFYSIASLWEVAIKQSLHKLDADFTLPELDDQCRLAGIKRVSIEPTPPLSWPDGLWECCQCAIVAKSNNQYQLGIGNIGTGNTFTIPHFTTALTGEPTATCRATRAAGRLTIVHKSQLTQLFTNRKYKLTH